jgi:hypothetical protein
MRQTFDLRLALCVTIGLAPTLGCGDGAFTDDLRPPIARLRGTVTTDQAFDLTDVRVALVWRVGGTIDAPPLRVAQDTPLTAGFPAQFELAITELPPAEALTGPDSLPTSAPENGRFAYGAVVAYRDRNQNGQLDLTPVTADAFVDELVGYNEYLTVIYEIDTPNTGYFLIVGEPYEDGIGFFARPIDTPVTLPLHLEPHHSCFLTDWPIEDEDQSLGRGPWPFLDDWNCPAGLPAETEELRCWIDPESQHYSYFALWTTPTSDFILTTCGQARRGCYNGAHPGAGDADDHCPCDPAAGYTCWDGL